jgi:hypothetical protein
MTAQRQLSAQDTSGELVCWCCGRHQPIADVLRVGEHPEVVVCLGCAHRLRRVARAREDQRSPSPVTRDRDGLRALRGLGMRRGWHTRPVVGPVLRWLGTRLP